MIITIRFKNGFVFDKTIVNIEEGKDLLRNYNRNDIQSISIQMNNPDKFITGLTYEDMLELKLVSPQSMEKSFISTCPFRSE